MCEGYFDKELRAWKRTRSLAWTITLGYADPKDLPENQQVWWPMAGDVMPKRPTAKLTKAKQNKIAERIKAELERGKASE
ncbi:hypothetical protein [Pedobacter sp. HDW13]|uniref:hypothetical protein n=1 Tax=Pedobacter sp. HDW13 TaxID=2714940 RepID=UPI001F11120F|nr:hypothetical protein [Pedobacter sp. HDW13]